MRLETGWVRYASAGQDFPAYFARPAGAGQGLPAVLVIHEVFGADEYIEDIANRLATAGYEALAPDLLAAGGARSEEVTRARVNAARTFLNANPAAWSGPAGREEALARAPEAERERLTATLARLFGSDEGRAQRFARYTEVMVAGVAHLRGAGGVARKVASLGFCMGGGLSGLLAATEPTLNAAVVFYGAPPPAERASAIKCPMIGHYADPDPRITPNVPAFAEVMRANGQTFEPHLYAGARHGFFNDTTGAYHLEAARAAWARTLSFLLQHLA